MQQLTRLIEVTTLLPPCIDNKLRKTVVIVNTDDSNQP
jgi:hypothetical protein